jgi:hypothetical protein
VFDARESDPALEGMIAKRKNSGLSRHAVFPGLRGDKAAKHVHREP